MQDLNDLYYFAQVVDYGGFSPAGRATGVPKSKLSRRVAGLEDRLGVRLINRSTRRFSVTETGQLYYRHCKAMLVEAEAAQDAVAYMQAAPRGTVRISCPIDLLQAAVGDMFTAFLAAQPGVTLHLDATNRRVDPVAENIDIALRVRPPPLEDSELVLRVLEQRCLYLVASPSLFADNPKPQTTDELTDWPSLDTGPPHRDHVWNLTNEAGDSVAVRHQPRLVTDNMVALRNAALAGVGIVQLPSLMVDEQLATGELIQLLPHWDSPPGIVHIVYPSRRGQLPAVRALIEFLAERFKN